MNEFPRRGSVVVGGRESPSCIDCRPMGRTDQARRRSTLRPRWKGRGDLDHLRVPPKKFPGVCLYAGSHVSKGCVRGGTADLICGRLAEIEFPNGRQTPAPAGEAGRWPSTPPSAGKSSAGSARNRAT